MSIERYKKQVQYIEKRIAYHHAEFDTAIAYDNYQTAQTHYMHMTQWIKMRAEILAKIDALILAEL